MTEESATRQGRDSAQPHVWRTRGLEDVGTMTIKMNNKAELYAGSNIDVKGYNINKEQLTVPVKNRSTFAAMLGFTAERLQQ